VSVGPAGLAEVGEHVMTLADYEGLPAHAASIRLRQGAGASRTPTPEVAG
jgi:histidinol dehydrogenase